MTETPNLAIVLIDEFADWEYGLLAAAAARWFGVSVSVLTPGGGAVSSMAGLSVTSGGALEAADSGDLDAVALIGSDGWSADDPPDPGALLRAVHGKGGVVGAICGGTVALARSGLMDGRAHTSNDRQWLKDAAGAYRGMDGYVDTPAAVADDRVVTAPGTAPTTFAAEMLGALLPHQSEQVDKVRVMLAAEHKG